MAIILIACKFLLIGHFYLFVFCGGSESGVEEEDYFS
jgi:hypothetical protein